MTHSKAAQIASAARYYSANSTWRAHCLGDVVDNVLKVDQHTWDHLPRRAKTFGARIEIGRGWHGSVDGRAWLEVIADDNSRCTVVLV